MKRISLIIMLFLAASLSVVAQKHRILISTDIGGTDPDDNQSMIHLMMYTDLFDLEGLVSTPSFGNGSKQEMFRMIDIFAKDYPQLKRKYPSLMPPNYLKSICKQGRRDEAPIWGYDTPTEGSRWIVHCANKRDSRPLWVLVWGALEDVAQALHDAPQIAPKLRVYWIGGPNKKWGSNAYTYIAENFPNLWFIECNASYRGFIGSPKDITRYQANYWNDCMKGHGAMGNDFVNYYKGLCKMGDTPSLLYLMGVDAKGKPFDANRPDTPHWGGQFEPMGQSPKYIITGPMTAQDTIATYAIMEWQLKGPKINKPVGTVCFTMRTDKQNWRGYYMGEGNYMVRYAPKAPATLAYTITSDIKGFPSHEGTFVVGSEWPAVGKYQLSSGNVVLKPMPLGNSWWTDCSNSTLASGESDYEDYAKQSGKWQGAATVARWREQVMKDWEQRFKVLK